MALTEPRTIWGRITRYPSPRRRVALHTYLLYFVVTYTHHQNDTCVTLFAGAAVMLKPFTQPLAIDGKPGSTWERWRQTWERRRHVWEHLESQSCIQCVFSSMYLCIYIATLLHTVHLDCGCRGCLRAIRGAPENDNRVNSEIHSEAMI